jgi:hypothetical protein
MLMSTVMALFTTALMVGPAHAQTATTSKSGAFTALSPGNQKIARSLYEAQTTTTSKLTLDQIAVMKQEGQGWGNVFRDMKAQGRVTARNLGDVVSTSNHHATAPTTAGTSLGTAAQTKSGGLASSSATASTAKGRGAKAANKPTGSDYATAAASGGSQRVVGDNRGHVTASAKPGASGSGNGQVGKGN